MIRILHIVSYLTISSGVMHVIMNYYRHIDRNLIQFDFLFFEKGTYDEENYIDEINSLGGNVYFVNKPSLKCTISVFKEFNNFFKINASKYCAIHLHELYLIHFIKIFTCRYGIDHLIANAHSSRFSENIINAIRNRILCLGITKVATQLFACSGSAAKCYFGKQAIDSNRIYYLHNAIDLEKYRFNEQDRNSLREEMGVNNKIVIGHIGRMVPVKNHLFILEEFSKLKKLNCNVALFLVGDGPLRKKIEEKIIALGIESSVYLLGVRKDIPRILSAMDFFWLPSIHEGFPVTGVEAQANGLKCFFSATITEEIDLTEYSRGISLQNWEFCFDEINCFYDRKKQVPLNRKLLHYDIKSACKRLEHKYLSM